MVHVRHVRMPVTQALMAMQMGVRFAGWIIPLVRMLVVLVMDMRMRMLQGLVNVLVVVVLG